MTPNIIYPAEFSTESIVLVVDDEAFILEVIKRVLADEPFRVLTTTSGIEAIKILEQEPVDVLMTDLMMPQMSGIELLRRARSLQPFYMQTIVLTAYGTMETAIKAMRLGASDYLGKPFENEILRNTVIEAVGRAKEINIAQQKASELRDRSRSIFTNVPAGIMLVDELSHEIIDINPAACNMVGADRSELIGQVCYQSVCASGDGACPVPDLTQPLKNSAHRLKTKSGEFLPILKSVSQIKSAGRDLRLETFLDLSEHERLREELVTNKEAFHAIVERSLDGIIIVDSQGITQFANLAACELFGTTKKECIGQPFGFPISTETSVEIDIVHQKNGQITAEMLVAESTWRGEIAFIATLRDISERKNAERRAQNMAHFDQLTGLPNRRLLLDRMGIALSRAKRNSLELAVFFLDLDGFKPINDTFGHDAGDEILKEVALRLKKLIRESDTVARIGGDEFVVILNEVQNQENIITVAQKIIEQINSPIRVDGNNLNIGCSIGISLYPEDGENQFELMKNADSAMYQVKNQGKNTFAFFGQEVML